MWRSEVGLWWLDLPSTLLEAESLSALYVSARLAGLQAAGGSPESVSYLIVGTLQLHICAIMSSCR